MKVEKLQGELESRASNSSEAVRAGKVGHEAGGDDHWKLGPFSLTEGGHNSTSNTGHKQQSSNITFIPHSPRQVGPIFLALKYN